MRSSKSRSRSKSNRSSNNSRQVGNIVNRVFDSSGPESKVRGTPQQIIDKYNQLARDAQLSGDRVATENFQQHAEHYLRMLSDALREQAERQAQQQQNQQSQQNNQNQPNSNQHAQPQNPPQQQNPQQDRQSEQQRGNPRRQDRGETAPAPEQRSVAPAPEQRTEAPAPVKKADDVIDMTTEADAGLVETPEDKPQKPKRIRRKPTPVAPVADEPAQAPASEDAAPRNSTSRRSRVSYDFRDRAKAQNLSRSTVSARSVG